MSEGGTTGERKRESGDAEDVLVDYALLDVWSLEFLYGRSLCTTEETVAVEGDAGYLLSVVEDADAAADARGFAEGTWGTLRMEAWRERIELKEVRHFTAFFQSGFEQFEVEEAMLASAATQTVAGLYPTQITPSATADVSSDGTDVTGTGVFKVEASPTDSSQVQSHPTNSTSMALPPPFLASLSFARTHLAPIAIDSYPDAYRDFKRALSDSLLAPLPPEPYTYNSNQPVEPSKSMKTPNADPRANPPLGPERREHLARDLATAVTRWFGVAGGETGGRLGVLLRYLSLSHNHHSFVRGLSSPLQPACERLLLPDPCEAPPSPADALADVALESSGVNEVSATGGLEGDAAVLAQGTSVSTQDATSALHRAARHIRGVELLNSLMHQSLTPFPLNRDPLTRTCIDPRTGSPYSRLQVATRSVVGGLGLGWAVMDEMVVRYARWRGLIKRDDESNTLDMEHDVTLSRLMVPMREHWRARYDGGAGLRVMESLTGSLAKQLPSHANLPIAVKFAIGRCETLECLIRGRIAACDPNANDNVVGDSMEVDSGGVHPEMWTERAFKVWRESMASATLADTTLLPAHKECGALLVYNYNPPDPSNPIASTDLATLRRQLDLLLGILSFIVSTIVFPILKPPAQSTTLPREDPVASDDALPRIVSGLLAAHRAYVRFQGDDPDSPQLAAVAMGVPGLTRVGKIAARFLAAQEGWEKLVGEAETEWRKRNGGGIGGVSGGGTHDARKREKKERKGALEEELMEEMADEGDDRQMFYLRRKSAIIDLASHFDAVLPFLYPTLFFWLSPSDLDARRLGIDDDSISQLVDIMQCSRVDAVAMLAQHGGDLAAVLGALFS
ncbi:hypothetical protein HDU93_008499 [Gonapodya sp. JEL0774]|nr:hypothetical protein HDU93_008499 [Gonapodya sp. JEL0774]